jgi:hypothetical protein
MPKGRRWFVRNLTGKHKEALGWWVNTVRTQYTWRGQGKKTSLTDAQISELDSLGFVWKAGTKKNECSPRYDGVWKKRVQELKAYVDTYGHCRVPFLYEPNKALGYWVNKVRIQYTSRKNSLTDARILELDSLGFVWKAGAKEKEQLSVDELRKKRVQEQTAFSNMRMQEQTAFNKKYLETYRLNSLLLHKHTEELLQKLLSRKRDCLAALSLL